MRCIRRNRECQYITENIEETHHEALKRENRNLRRQSQQLSHALATAQARLLMSAETPSLDAAATSWAERELLAIHPNVYRLHPPLRMINFKAFAPIRLLTPVLSYRYRGSVRQSCPGGLALEVPGSRGQHQPVRLSPASIFIIPGHSISLTTVLVPAAQPSSPESL